MSMTRLLLAILALALLLGACGNETAPTATEDGTDTSLVAEWVLISGEGPAGPIPLHPSASITLKIDDQGTIGGRAACNSYGSDAPVIVDMSWTLSDVSSTEMGCEPTVMESESAYLTSLILVDSVALIDDELQLTGPEVSLTFARVAPIPEAELLGTNWILDSLIHGDAVSNSPLMDGSITLLLGTDGTLLGSTGCRTLEGAYVISGAEVIATQLNAVGDCQSGAAAELDEQIIEVLADGFAVDITGSRLTILSSGNSELGLSYQKSE